MNPVNRSYLGCLSDLSDLLIPANQLGLVLPLYRQHLEHLLLLEHRVLRQVLELQLAPGHRHHLSDLSDLLIPANQLALFHQLVRLPLEHLRLQRLLLDQLLRSDLVILLLQQSLGLQQSLEILLLRQPLEPQLLRLDQLVLDPLLLQQGRILLSGLVCRQDRLVRMAPEHLTNLVLPLDQPVLVTL